MDVFGSVYLSVNKSVNKSSQTRLPKSNSFRRFTYKKMPVQDGNNGLNYGQVSEFIEENKAKEVNSNEVKSVKFTRKISKMKRIFHGIVIKLRVKTLKSTESTMKNVPGNATDAAPSKVDVIDIVKNEESLTVKIAEGYTSINDSNFVRQVSKKFMCEYIKFTEKDNYDKIIPYIDKSDYTNAMRYYPALTTNAIFSRTELSVLFQNGLTSDEIQMILRKPESRYAAKYSPENLRIGNERVPNSSTKLVRRKSAPVKKNNSTNTHSKRKQPIIVTMKRRFSFSEASTHRNSDRNQFCRQKFSSQSFASSKHKEWKLQDDKKYQNESHFKTRKLSFSVNNDQRKCRPLNSSCQLRSVESSQSRGVANQVATRKISNDSSRCLIPKTSSEMYASNSVNPNRTEQIDKHLVSLGITRSVSFTTVESLTRLKKRKFSIKRKSNSTTDATSFGRTLSVGTAGFVPGRADKDDALVGDYFDNTTKESVSFCLFVCVHFISTKIFHRTYVN